MSFDTSLDNAKLLFYENLTLHDTAPFFFDQWFVIFFLVCGVPEDQLRTLNP
jgi:hypothetical protein